MQIHSWRFLFSPKNTKEAMIRQIMQWILQRRIHNDHAQCNICTLNPPSKQNNQCLSCNRAKELSYGNFERNHSLVLLENAVGSPMPPLRLFLLIWGLPSAFPAAGLPDPACMEFPLPRQPAERKKYERKEQSCHMRGESDGMGSTSCITGIPAKARPDNRR